MVAVIEFADVTVRRGQATLLDGRRLAGRGGRALGGPRPQRRRQDHAAAGRLGADPPDRRRGRDPRRGARHRRRLRAAAAHRPDQRRRSPSGSRAHELVRDVVVSASYGVVGRWREAYDDLDHDRGRELLARGRRRPPARPHLRHPERGGAQAGADRPGADDRPRAAAARRAGRRPRPRRPRGPRVDAVDAGAGPVLARPPCWSPTTSRRSRPASPTRCCCAQGRVVAAGPIARRRHRASTSPRPSACRLVLHARGRPLRGASHGASTRLTRGLTSRATG